MSKIKIRNYQILSAVFVAILGTILHFVFKWSGNNLFVGAISAVNESTWEHLKLLYYPMLITIIVGHFYFGKDIDNFVCAKTVGILTAMIFTVVIFYTYTGIVGTNYATINILIFYVAVVIGEYASYRIIISNLPCYKNVALIVLVVLLACFVKFTYITPQIGLFKDSVSENYGIVD
ncbi:MAG: hypothetical protein IJX99_10135 [Clostridia bacterium]|nr:hypothetical protein [Clostridia bacterium]